MLDQICSFFCVENDPACWQQLDADWIGYCAEKNNASTQPPTAGRR
jgi:hypothetical protein